MTAARRLTRSRTDRKVADVAGGIGDYFGIDPVSLAAGLTSGALWLVFVLDGLDSVGDLASVAWPAALFAIGLTLLVGSFRRRGH